MLMLSPFLDAQVPPLITVQQLVGGYDVVDVGGRGVDAVNQPAYSRPRLPLIPDEACHPFHAKAATDSTATLPPRQAA